MRGVTTHNAQHAFSNSSYLESHAASLTTESADDYAACTMPQDHYHHYYQDPYTRDSSVPTTCPLPPEMTSFNGSSSIAMPRTNYGMGSQSELAEDQTTTAAKVGPLEWDPASRKWVYQEGSGELNSVTLGLQKLNWSHRSSPHPMI